MKNLIPQSFIQDVVARTDIVSVIEARIDLKKRGNTHVACCPFHAEKTPSFSVSHAKQFYYCFGCGAHGNVIGFLMNYDHLSFIDVITDLAQQVGMTIPIETNAEDKAQFDILYNVLREAQLLYEKQLKESPIAIAYLKSRGLTGKIAKTFCVGYAPSAWEFLSNALGKNKSTQALMTAGMTIEKQAGRYYDRFRDRILFPIRDTRGRTIAFGGRTLADDIPKYLNSPETPIFHKNQTLYGLYEMCQHRKKPDRIVVVEGYLDVIALAQHDVTNAVATLGTALNAKHIQLLLRYANEIIFCFDGDAAGRKAAWKAVTISLPLLRDGLDFRFLFLPQGEDPDSLIRKIGHDAFESLIDKATALSVVFFNELEKEFPIDSIAGKAAYAKQAKEYLETMPEGIYKNLFMEQLAQRIHVERNQLQEKPISLSLTAPKKMPRKFNIRLTPAELAIQLLLHDPTLATLAAPTTLTLTAPSVEKTVLLAVIHQCVLLPHTSVSELLETLHHDEHRALIAAITTREMHIPAEGRKVEFLGALQCLHEQDQEQQLSHLIEQAKKSELNGEEKQLLQALFSKKQAPNAV